MVLASCPEGRAPHHLVMGADLAITVLANLSIPSSVKFYGTRPGITVPVNHSIAGSAKYEIPPALRCI